jgi:polyphosphate kinase
MPQKKYINRELSWLDFNERVLQEAKDIKTPLLERFKFLGIFSNNRDEFFRVRVSTLKRMRNHKKVDPADKQHLSQILNTVQRKVAKQEEEYTNIYNHLLDEAKKSNIFFLKENELNSAQNNFVKAFFDREVRSHIFPLIIGSNLKYRNFKNQSIYLVVDMKSSKNPNINGHALIELPTKILPRFVQIPSESNKTYFMFLEDIVRSNLKSIFAIQGYDEFDAFIVKLTREAELEIDNDVLRSFLEILSESVEKRKKAPPVRFIYDRNISKDLLKDITHVFGIKKDSNLKAGGRYHNLKDLMNFPLNTSNLKFKKLLPIDHPELPEHLSKFDLIKRNDILVFYPYHSFSSLNNLMWEASIDPIVRSIKMTFYRVSRNSTMMRALINAARNGKRVTVFMELQARFDEEDNIYWTEKLQNEGVRVIPTIPDFKVHSKLILIRRKENGKNTYYSNISTGNFHEATAKVYSDISLLTANELICEDVNNVFGMFEKSFLIPKFNKLKVSPFGIRKFINKKIDAEIANTKQGKKSGILLKLNSLVDEQIIDKIYEAADAGVKVQLIIRGICVLKVDFIHQNIEAFSVVDRYLEHSRVFVFNNNNNPLYYISSADLMPRNLDHRIEVACPILSEKCKNELKDILDIQLKDNVKARELQGNLINKYRKTNSEKQHQSQIETYNYLFNKANNF